MFIAEYEGGYTYDNCRQQHEYVFKKTLLTKGIKRHGRSSSSGNSFSFGMSQARSSLSQKESYFSNSSDSSGRKYDDMFLMMPLYNRSGRLNVPDDSSKTDLAGEESPEGTEALTRLQQSQLSFYAAECKLQLHRNNKKGLYVPVGFYSISVFPWNVS